MFYHGFDNYMDYAFPLDELRPMSCTGEDSLGGYALTLVSQFTTEFSMNHDVAPYRKLCM